MSELKPNQTLTKSQRSRFFAMLKSAKINLGISGEEGEDYRKSLIREACGVDSLTEVNRTTGYDRLMSRLAVDAGDYAAAINYGGGTLSRIHFLIGRAAREICDISSDWRGGPWAYVAGILKQSGIDYTGYTAGLLADYVVNENYWLDISEADMKRVLMMLQARLTQLRKKGKQ